MSDTPEPYPIRHILFRYMGPVMERRLRDAGVTSCEQMEALGVDGLVALGVAGMTRSKAEWWKARAHNILAALNR